MDILQFTENKSVISLFVLIFLFFLCTIDSTFVGFGFGFLLIMSLYTKNIVLCVTGSFILTCAMMVVLQNTKEGLSFGDRCNATCFRQNQDISKQNSELRDTIKGLNNDIVIKDAENGRLNRNITDLNNENGRINNKNIRLHRLNTTLNRDNMNLTYSEKSYRRLVDSISIITSS